MTAMLVLTASALFLDVLTRVAADIPWPDEGT